ncbi:MAG: hypothetical protein SGPRY_009043 [Prymnesium sp.]
MVVSEKERSEIRRDWEAYFQCPTDFDPRLLPEDKKLMWIKLPLHVETTQTSKEPTTTNSSLQLENPPVDPTYGHRRSVALSVTERQRNTGLQFDKKLLGPLQTVCCGVILQCAADANVSFTTMAYEHAPQVGVPGVWGTFRKQENSKYDPKDVLAVDANLCAITTYCASTLSWLEYRVAVRRVITASGDGSDADEQAREATMPQRKCRRIAAESDDTSPRGSDAGDDTPAPIPPGFEAYEWDGAPLLHFMLWSALGESRPSWHFGTVSSRLHPSISEGCTHDARFDGSRWRRVTTLIEEAAREGVLLVLLRKVATGA